MATRSEQYRAQEQRHRSKAAAKRAKSHAAKTTRAKKSDHAHANAHAARHATVALEPRSKQGKATRKSTRSSANRIKADVNVSERRAEKTQASPEARYRTRK